MAIHKITLESTCGGSTSWFEVGITSNAKLVISQPIIVTNGQGGRVSISEKRIFLEAGDFPTKITIEFSVETEANKLDIGVDHGGVGSLSFTSTAGSYNVSLSGPTSSSSGTLPL